MERRRGRGGFIGGNLQCPGKLVRLFTPPPQHNWRRYVGLLALLINHSMFCSGLYHGQYDLHPHLSASCWLLAGSSFNTVLSASPANCRGNFGLLLTIRLVFMRVRGRLVLNRSSAPPQERGERLGI